MTRRFSRPIPLLLALIVGTFIPVMIAAVRVVQIPLGTVPDDSLRLTSAPVAFFLHSLAGLLFGAGVIVHASEGHEHSHRHPAMEHDHAHRHDDGHHTHAHAEPVVGEHAHPHSHEAIDHVHSHGEDVHHRHVH